MYIIICIHVYIYTCVYTYVVCICANVYSMYMYVSMHMSMYISPACGYTCSALSGKGAKDAKRPQGLFVILYCSRPKGKFSRPKGDFSRPWFHS